MSSGERAILAIAETLISILVAGIAIPVIWFVSRIAGLIRPMVMLSGGPLWLMILGGIAFGIPIGMSVGVAIGSLGARGKRDLFFGGLGGAIGGLSSSLMFFPIVVYL